MHEIAAAQIDAYVITQVLIRAGIKEYQIAGLQLGNFIYLRVSIAVTHLFRSSRESFYTCAFLKGIDDQAGTVERIRTFRSVYILLAILFFRYRNNLLDLRIGYAIGIAGRGGKIRCQHIAVGGAILQAIPLAVLGDGHSGTFAVLAHRRDHLCGGRRLLVNLGTCALGVYIDVNEVQETRRVFKEATAYQLVDTLIGCCSSEGTGSRANFGRLTVAGKTGTNSNNVGVTFAGMTGYYAGAVWIGSDYYKPLNSDATGSSAAAPLWAAMMSEVHELTDCTVDRDIIPGSAGDYGLYKETVCGVSGMLPTEACQHDVNSYPLITDYYTVETVPTSYCNMHRAVTLCRKSGMVASDYCDSRIVGGIIYIPEGHPLRYASDMDVVQGYFYGASTSEYSAGIGKCRHCG